MGLDEARARYEREDGCSRLGASAQETKGNLQERFRVLREATPRSEHLKNLTPEALKEGLASRG